MYAVHVLYTTVPVKCWYTLTIACKANGNTKWIAHHGPLHQVQPHIENNVFFCAHFVHRGTHFVGGHGAVVLQLTKREVLLGIAQVPTADCWHWLIYGE